MSALLALILTISSVSGTTINSPDEVLTVYATASGLQNKQYLQVVFTKEGEKTSNYFGFTKNLSNEWYQYKSSPTDNDLASYFYNFTPVSGAWFGQLNVKMNLQDDGFKGPGNYILKIFKPTSSSSSTNSATIAINVSLPATPAATVVTELPTPAIEFYSPAAANLGENFKTTANLKNFAANTEFYLKIRDKVQTKNGNNFLSDNEDWDFFPLIKTDGSGNWFGEIWGLISEDKNEGLYKIKLRVKKKDKDSFFESDTKEIKLAKLVKIITPEVVIASKSPEINFVLGTKSASLAAKITKPKTEGEKFDPTNLVLLIGGLVLSGGSVIIALKFKHGI